MANPLINSGDAVLVVYVSPSLRRTSDDSVSASASKFMVMGRVTSMLRAAEHTITPYQKCHYRIAKAALPRV